MAMTREQLLRQQRMARKSMAKLAKLYPGAFDKDNKPIVATLQLPTLKDKK
jgi:hypothetical protein